MMKRWFWKWLPALMICGFLITAGVPVTLAATAGDSVNVTADMNSWITITSPPDVSLGSFDRGTDTSGTADWAVATNNAAGYKLEVKAATDPAMDSNTSPTAYYFDDYNMDVTTTPSAWSVAATDAEFGYTASGSDTGSEYASGTLYRGFAGATDIQIAASAAETLGTTSTVKFRAKVGSSKLLLADTYTAVITATATTL